MKRDEGKTKEQLIVELDEMRKKLSKLEVIETKRKKEGVSLPGFEEYQKLLELLPVGVTILDMKGVIIACNPSVYLRSGYSKDDFIGKHFTKVSTIRPVDIPKYMKVFAPIIRGKAPKPFEVMYTRKDGTTGWTKLYISLLRLGRKRTGIQVIQHDITEHKQAEEALRGSEEKYRLLFNSSSNPTSVYDSNGVLQLMNEAAAASLGGVPTDFIGKPISKIHPSVAQTAMERIRMVVETEESREFDTMIDLPSGRHWFWSNFQPVKDANGNVNAVQIISYDITERKQAEEALQAAEQNFRNSLDNSPLGTRIINAEGETIHANRAILDIYGYSSIEEFKAIPAIERHTLKSYAEWQERVSKRKAGEPVPDRFEKSIIRKGGEVRNLEVFHREVLWGGEKQFQLIYHDITEHKQAEEALREVGERHRAIFEQAAESIVLVDAETGALVDFNDSAHENLGYTREEFGKLTIPDFEVIESAEEVAEHIKKIIKEGSDVFETQHRTKNGEIRDIEVSSKPLHIGGRKYAQSVWRDITERKQAEEREKQLQQELILSSRLATVGEMAAGIAHEINNPLTGVVGFAGLLLKKDIPEDIRNDVNTIYEGAQRIASITSEMLTFARQYKPERTSLNINDIIETTLAMRAYEMESSNIKVTTQLASDMPLTFADAGQLQQVFLNIVLNAEIEMIKAHGKGTLSVKTERIDNAIRVSFKDDGPGILKKNLERIFDPFFTTREVGQGAGLGLSVSHGIVTQHGGKIYAQSRLGKGATFFVELPIVTKEEQLELAELAIQPGKVSKARVLVVDDDTIVQKFLTEILREEGHEVEIVENSDDALDRLGNEDYDVILLDVKLPGISGIELYRYMQKTAKSLARRVVFITGDVMSQDTMGFLSKTRAPYITKPFDVEQLLKDIARILSQKS